MSSRKPSRKWQPMMRMTTYAPPVRAIVKAIVIHAAAKTAAASRLYAAIQAAMIHGVNGSSRARRSTAAVQALTTQAAIRAGSVIQRNTGTA